MSSSSLSRDSMDLDARNCALTYSVVIAGILVVVSIIAVPFDGGRRSRKIPRKICTGGATEGFIILLVMAEDIPVLLWYRDALPGTILLPVGTSTDACIAIAFHNSSGICGWSGMTHP